jgi:uncharacterized protein YfiM (DUF2279 family)
LEFAGTSAADGTHITPKELMLSAIENLRAEMGQQITHEGGYAVRQGAFARDFGQPQTSAEAGEEVEEVENLSTYAFPVLFPYGVGGLEARRPVTVSFAEHTRWCLLYYDRRFQKARIFPYWSMSIQQKRQALYAAKLMMSQKDFDRTSAILSQLTEEDLDKAAREEETGLTFSDSRVTLLRKMVQITMQKVMGSDAARALNRSKIWSTSLYMNPMNLWMTLNFVDRHYPICQVFAGQQINMDNLQNIIGLTAQERARNVADNPFAAAQFFFFLAQTVLETLFGFRPKGELGDSEMGVLGRGNAYFGAVEAQGRGSLHLHLIMWLRDSPNAEETTTMLQLPAFRDKIKSYLRANVRSHIDDLTEEVLSSMDSTPELAWGRPPDPDSPDYKRELRTLEIKLARSQQYHKCTANTCLVYDKGKRRTICKRRAPFELSPDDVVTEAGEIRTKRLIEQLNTWCPSVFYGGRCNNDIKIIITGAEARAIAWYITHYATKKQGCSFNRSAIFAKTFMYHQKNSQQLVDARKKNQSFVFRCGLSLNKEMEYSGQQTMAYLMGWGDTIQSHTYTTVYWSNVVRALKVAFPELVANSEASRNVSTYM